jgi:hypothetical protein
MQHEPKSWTRIAVDQGRLSVDLKQAEIQMVLARIAEDAEITIMVAPIDQRAISILFTDMELEAGLRRLLELASLNYTIIYSQGHTGTAVIKEVHVLGTKQPGGQPVVAESDGDENKERGASHVMSPSALDPQVAAPPLQEQGASEVVERLQKFFGQGGEGTPQGTSPAAEGKGKEALDVLKETFQQLSNK